MKFNIRPYWADYKEEILFTIDLYYKDFDKYEKEIIKRFWEMEKLETEEEKQEYMKINYLCDISEVEIWDMSINTLQDYLKFLTKTLWI